MRDRNPSPGVTPKPKLRFGVSVLERPPKAAYASPEGRGEFPMPLQVNFISSHSSRGRWNFLPKTSRKDDARRNRRNLARSHRLIGAKLYLIGRLGTEGVGT